MNAPAAIATRQTATPEADSKNELKLQRKCKCGQHTSGGHECSDCKKKRSKLQRWSMDYPAPAAMLHTHGHATSAAVSTPAVGFDLSRVRTHTPVLRTVSRLQRALRDGASADNGANVTEEAVLPAPGAMPEAAPPSEAPPEVAAASEATPETAPEAIPEATPAAAPAATPDTTPATPSASLIANDSATDLQPGQLRQSDFLDQLHTAVCAEAEAALAGTEHSTTGCPYLASWFAYYRGQSSDHVEDALRRYAPEARAARTATEYIPLVAARVRQGVERWARTGEITGVPEGITLGLPGTEATGAQATTETAGSVQLKARNGGERRSDDPEAVQAELGAGRPLESGVRSRMEGAFGRSFSGVRMHTGKTARRLSSEQNARAFTVGRHVAFGAGEYRPGTMIGDALIAHELAHVVQQVGGAEATQAKADSGASYSALEEDADRSAVGVVASLWRGMNDTFTDISENAVPSLKSGLRLQRCSNDESGRAATACPTQTVTMGGAECGAKYGAIGKYCYSGAKGWWFKEKVVLGSPNTCVPGAKINQTTTPFQATGNCVADAIFNFNGPPEKVAPCKIVTDQIVFTGPTKAEVEKCKYKNEQIIEVTEKAGSKPKSGKVITSSAGVSTECDWKA